MSSATAPAQTPAKKSGDEYHRYPWWAPRFWHGMTASAWYGLLTRNRWKVSPSRWPMVFAVCFFSIFNSCMRLLQNLIFGKAIAATEIRRPPIFIIGHWRSGTTHLHELMVLDEQFTYPTTWECFAPNHFLVSNSWSRFLGFLLPSQRPMDNMVTGWQRPQEDEFALLNMGAGSPYETMAFPNHRPVRHEFLNLTDVTPEQRTHWQQSLLAFMKLVTLRSARQARKALKKGSPEASPALQAAAEEGKQIMLKSPPHTARVKVLLKLFPDARFIHIVRDPAKLYASNVRLWKSLWDVQGCQAPKFDDRGGKLPSVETYVLETLQQMYCDFDRDVQAVPPGHFCEVRYEDLVREPMIELRRIYDTLELEGFGAARPRFEAYLAEVKDYKPNRHTLTAETQAVIDQHWGDFARRYGYAQP